MTLKSLTIIAFTAVLVGTVPSVGHAQNSIRDVPANFPPASYSGRQFVDNNGCVYVRAGFDGAVTWVPRVSRQRKHICGQTPTFGATRAAAAEPAPAPAPTPTPVTIEAPASEPVAATAPAARPAVAAAPSPAPAPTIVTRTEPKPAATPVVRTTTAPLAKPVSSPRVVVKAPASKPAAAPPPRVVRRAPVKAAPQPAALPSNARIVKARNYHAAACAGASGTVTRIVNGRELTVRCGPQATPHVTVIRRGDAPSAAVQVYNNPGWQSPASPTAHTRIVPRHVYEQRDTQVSSVPEGYRPAWQDDRLNMRRAEQSVEGYLATQSVWTNTVPRKLVVKSGKPAKVKQPVIAYRATGGSTPVVSTQGTAATAKKAPVVSTKSSPRKPAAGARWVEIGVFTTEAKAQAAAQRLQSAGLPVKFGVFQRGGQKLRRVLVGPYASNAAIQAALGKVRRVGYTSAYLR